MRYNNQDLLNAGSEMMGCENFGGITVREYQLEILDILKEIDRICKKNNIPYFLMFGSLIGAVRHKGFVPWDDDADVSMTRENYRKFRDACEKDLSDGYVLESYESDMNVGLFFHRIRKKNTTYINRFEISKHGRYAGFYVDIIILDYLSRKPVMEKIQKRSLHALHRVVCAGFSQGNDHLSPFWTGVVKVVQTIIGKKRIIALLERILGSVKYEDSDLLIAQSMTPGRMDWLTFDKKFFDKSWELPFEDMMISVPSNALTLLNHNYCKRLLREGTLIENCYEDEKQAILDGKFYKYDDIMFIPPFRKRGSHLEVIFDSRCECSFYDSYYMTKFDKKKNDKAAIKERRYREKSLQYLAVLNKNEELAKRACEEIRIREVLRIYQEKVNNGELTATLCNKYAKALNELNIVKHIELSIEELMLAVEVLIKAAYILAAKRCLGMIKKQKQIMDSQDLGRLEKDIERHLEAYYAIFEKDISLMESYIDEITESDCYLVALIKAVLYFEKNNDVKAEELFSKITEVADETFFAYYYLAKIAQKKNDKAKAVSYYKQSLDTTCYMPLLNMSLKELRELL